MEDHRRNAWYILGAAPLTAGGALAIGWLIAVDSSTAKIKPEYWGVPSYIAMGLIVLGAVIIGLIMTETWPFGFRRSQHASAPRIADSSSFKTPESTGTVTAAVGIVLNPGDPSPVVKMMHHSPVRPGLQTGDLPINMTTEGPIGHREVTEDGESWVWTFREVTFFNEGPRHETAHAWLMVNSLGDPGFTQLQRSPNTPIVLAPHETKQEALIFRLNMNLLPYEERLNPRSPVRLELMGASSLRQSRRVFFTKVGSN